MSTLVRVPFHGDELLAVQDDSGVWVSVRRLCDNLGLSPVAQRRKIQADGEEWRWCLIASPSAGGEQQALMLHLDHVPAWLMGINTSRVREDLRDQLRRYKREAREVVAAHFLRRRAEDSHAEFRARLLLVDPIKRDRLFRESVWRAIEALYREDAATAVRPSQAFKGYVGHIYRRFFGDRAKNELRDLNQAPERDRDYWYLTDEAFGELRDNQWHKVEALAMSAHRRFGCSRRAREEFWADLNHLTGYKPALGEPNPADERQLLLFERLDCERQLEGNGVHQIAELN